MDRFYDNSDEYGLMYSARDLNIELWRLPDILISGYLGNIQMYYINGDYTNPIINMDNLLHIIIRFKEIPLLEWIRFMRSSDNHIPNTFEYFELI